MSHAINVSRRQLIRGVIGLGLLATTGCGVRAGSSGTARGRMAGVVSERLLTLKVNGLERRVDVPVNETLVMTIRYKLGLTGTKLGCDRAECGACTVLLDGLPHYACSLLTHSVRGRKVVTIEGLEGADGTLHPVQQAFVDEMAPQCGFCTPGQIISAVALLGSNPTPTRQEVCQGLSGNICRCGAYEYYIRGVLRAAASLKT